tara:strand:- start:964 stop:1674 length:711 start_codon:yes stop_codon:yes gene_type:complete
MKKVAIMQPYFFPYVGYFQLINSVDQFVIYDNIQYEKKGWINRNRILSNGQDRIITLPLKKASDYFNVMDRRLSDNWPDKRRKMINLIKSCYAKAPYFKEGFSIMEESLSYEDTNLFNFLFNSLKKVNEYLNIQTQIIVSSSLDIDHTLKSQDKVISICKSLNAETYINAIGGVKLYKKEDFNKNNIKLNFIQSELTAYKQFKNNFLPWLSIVDVIMFNSRQEIRDKHLSNYNLIY